MDNPENHPMYKAAVRAYDRITKAESNGEILNSLGIDFKIWTTLSGTMCLGEAHRKGISLEAVSDNEDELTNEASELVELVSNMLLIGILLGVEFESEIRDELDSLFKDM